MSDGDLLSCPFCGGDDLRVYHGHGGDKVQCFGCHVSGVLVRIWNRRAALLGTPERMEPPATSREVDWGPDVGREFGAAPPPGEPMKPGETE